MSSYKMCSEIMQQIYRRTSMLNCNPYGLLHSFYIKKYFLMLKWRLITFLFSCDDKGNSKEGE